MTTGTATIQDMQFETTAHAARPEGRWWTDSVRYYLPTVVLVLTAWIVHDCLLRPPVFPVDDAYITLHNAQVLVSGKPDPNFLGAPALTGATSPVHLAIVAALMFCGLPPLWALDTAAWLGALVFALGIARLGRAFLVPPWPTFFLSIAGLICARVPHQLMNGLETGWTIAGITWALTLSAEDGKRPALGMAALCGTLPFLRPELAALSLLLIPIPAWRLWRTGRDVKAALQLFALSIGVATLAASPWLLWQFVATGSFVPGTISAKRYYFAEAGLPEDMKYLWVRNQFVGFLWACGPLSYAALVLPFTASGRAGILFTGALLVSYFCLFPGALGHYEQRYLYVLLPLLLFGAASAFRLFSRWPAPSRWVSLFVFVCAFQAATLAPATWKEHRAGQGFTRFELAGVAQWCDEHLPHGARLLIHDAGYISYATTFPMADIVGLKTPANIPFHREMTYATNGQMRAKAIHAAAFNARPDYLVVLGGWDRIYKITDGLRAYGWRLTPVREEGAYRVYRLTPPVDTPGTVDWTRAPVTPSKDSATL